MRFWLSVSVQAVSYTHLDVYKRQDLGYGEEIITVRQMNFADIDKLAEETGPFDFVLADLGVSSMQIDNPERGFSYKADGPLDLRLNPEAGISAAERLKTIDREELAGMLIENSDEPYACLLYTSSGRFKGNGRTGRKDLLLRNLS